MANQYSITVSNGADAVLKDLKDRGMKMSQCIDAAINITGIEAHQANDDARECTEDTDRSE